MSMTVTMHTNKGDMQLELFEKEAPETVRNFLSYVDKGHYNNTLFHRIIDNFMIQGGGFDQNFKQKPTDKPIRNEADNQIGNTVGTIAMARTNDPHSATSQFFINVADNSFLNFRAPTMQHYGYCVFGKVINGMDIVNQIKAVKTHRQGMYDDVPVEPVIITSIVRD